MAKVAFLGLGVMGYPMAGHLAAAGHEVTVFNRTAAKAESWVAQHGGASAATPAEAAREAEFIFACVGEDDDVRQMTIGENGAFSSMQKEAFLLITPPPRQMSQERFMPPPLQPVCILLMRLCQAVRLAQKMAS